MIIPPWDKLRMVYFRGKFCPSEAEIVYFTELCSETFVEGLKEKRGKQCLTCLSCGAHVQLRFLFALCAKARQSFAHMCLWPCALKKERTHMVRLQSRVSRAGGAREKRQTQRANARVNLRQGTVPRNPASA